MQYKHNLSGSSTELTLECWRFVGANVGASVEAFVEAVEGANAGANA